MSRPRVAVTGATGFLGRQLVRELTKRGCQVIAITRASSSIERLHELGAEISPYGLDNAELLKAAFRNCDVVFHLAGAVDFGSDWPRFQQANVVGTANAMNAAESAGVRRVVHCSSIVAVGASRIPQRLNECTRWNLGPMRVPYITTKRQAEELALAHNGPRSDVVVVNPACVLGPDDETSSEFGTMCRRFWSGRIPIHFGGGNNFVDVRDVVQGILVAWTHGRPGERYILGGVNRSMTAFFSSLAQAAGHSIPRWRLPNAMGPAIAFAEQRWSRQRSRAYLSPAQARLLPWFFYYDCSKAQQELNFRCRPLHETLRDTFQFWRERKAA